MTQKNVWSVFDQDSGEIKMSNKVFDDPDAKYGRILSDREMTFVNHGGASYAQLDRHFVWNGELSDRPIMPIVITSTTIGIGEKNGASLNNVPRGATVTIFADDIQFYQGPCDGTRLELSAPVPGIYTVQNAK